MFDRKQTLMSYCLGDKSKFEDGRIILATLSQLLTECSNRASRLKATDPAQADPPITPRNSKQRNAKVYRDSQLNIVETAVALCKYVLTFAASESTHGEILARIRPTLSASIFHNLEQLLTRHQKQLTHPSELLTPAAIMEMLPNDLSMSLQKCISEFEANLNIVNEEEMPTTNFEKSRFAVILAALYSDYTHGVKLPHRITEWLKQLAEWYPHDSESWAYVPTPGPWAPGEEPPAELMMLLAARAALSPTFPAESKVKRWLRPERLCWGWNVMEEEMVRVPSSILAQEDIPDDLDRSISILLYWQRY
jgi:hypothetical protein